MKTLFDEALESLHNPIILSLKESQNIADNLVAMLPFTLVGNGKIDWEKIPNQTTLNHIHDLKKFDSISPNDKCYIIWNDANLPVIQTTLVNVLRSFNDIEAVSFDTWIWIFSKNIVIESVPSSFRINCRK